MAVVFHPGRAPAADRPRRLGAGAETGTLGREREALRSRALTIA